MDENAEQFLEHLPAATRDSFNREELSAELMRFVGRARAAWPELRVDLGAFVRYAAARFDEGQTLSATHAEGLYLACACASGNNSAIAAFRENYGTVMTGVYRRLGFQRNADEITQRVLRTVLVDEGASGPAIARYTGRGSLANWVRVVTVREAYRTTKSERRTSQHEIGGVDERIMDRAVSDDANPELLHLKRDYRAKFKRSFQAAFDRLTHRERNILRYQYLDGLNLDQIATIYDAGRATVARWRAKARERLLSETRKIMRDEFLVPLEEFDNAMRLIESAMDVSLSRLLHGVAKDDSGNEP
jgi:RNA polymerase sigma-70 factor (ECF subfamily)